MYFHYIALYCTFATLLCRYRFCCAVACTVRGRDTRFVVVVVVVYVCDVAGRLS